ncbi:hypothetical protein CC53_gp155 [Rhizobium phage vB_RleS_L338C]|uniref:hypothetical protein n=1 Tax=Rhizobium phage vB_RleS_L338C TaxID=1414737 RepID=UPI0003D7E439|nr:hypothetical protein CC53_gp155 [Rhizobium phage vB_RleS_L338C]AHC30572.1 hypothetical protein L338C_155 [Rhizobium phage vB_RleS_L338C]QNH72104.1 hypothetical protein P11VFA_165 [Rhizobium phage P11VFA]
MTEIPYPHASTEPLETIRSNECESQHGSLCTRRFQAFWNEIVRLRDKVSELEGANPAKEALQLLQPATPEQRANIAPPEKPNVVASYYHEFVMTPDTIDIEDQGMAMIVHADADTPDSDPNTMAVRFHSWDETKEHEHLRSFAGKFVTITVEAFNV